jgi:hypothetical protein
MHTMFLAVLTILALAGVPAFHAGAAVPQFTERAQAAGLANPGFTFCLAADDFDGDGDVDVFEGNYTRPGWSSPHQPRLYANDGAGNFALVTDSAFAICVGSVWLDMDADGDLDAVTFTDGVTPLVCYENLGGLQFVDVTAAVGLAGVNAVQVDVCDFDGDSWLDLVVARRAASGTTIEVWCRRGTGFVQEQVFPTPTTTPTTAIDFITAFDWDRDRDPDLLVHDGGAYWDYDPRTYALENRPGEVTAFAVFPVPEFPATWSPFTWTDVDLDGDWDFFAGASDYHGGQNHLVVQQTPGTWVDVGAGAGLWAPWLYTSNATWGDLDLDGYPDLFEPRFAAFAGYTTSRLSRNNGDLTFSDISAALGATVAQYSNGNAWFDADADGDLDLLVARGGDHNTSYSLDSTTGMYFRNDTAGAGHWLQIDLAGAGGNRYGRGAEVAVHAGERLLLATPCGGSAPGRAQNPHRITVGLAQAATVDSVVVRWRSGRVTRLVNVPADRRITIAEASPLAFADVTDSYPGLNDEGAGNSVAWIDFDADGDLDLSVGAGANQTNRLFLNGLAGTGAVSFTSFADPLVAYPATTRGLAWGVFAGADRCPDLYLTAPYTANVLLENTCGSVTDRTDEVTAGQATPTNGVRVVDFDRDGRLDLHELRPEAPDRLLRNLGDWRFAEMPPSALSLVDGSFDAIWGDADGDGDQDGYVTREAPWPNVLLRNDGDGVFTDVTPAVLAITDRSQGATWGDYDNDGDLDLFVTNWLAPNRLFRNDGSFNFTDVTVSGMDVVRRGQSSVWGDLDNDGWLDLYVANQGDPNQMWLNVPDGAGGRTFEDVSYPEIADLGPSTGVCMADYDQDGDLDIYVGAHLGANTLLRNELQSGNHWLQFDLVATQSNASSIGSRLTVSAGGVTMYREVGANNGMWSQEPTRQHFGLGPTTAADSVVVQWPSGAVSRIANVQADTRMVVQEPPALSPNVLFADNFDTGPSPTWYAPRGGWRAENQHYLNHQTSGFADSAHPLFNGSADLTNYTVQMDFSPTVPASQGAVLNILVNLSQQAIPWPIAGTTGYNVGFGYNSNVGISRLDGNGTGEYLLNVPSDPRVVMSVGHVYVVAVAAEFGALKFKVYEKGTDDPGWLYVVEDDTYRNGHFGVFTWNTLGWIDNVVVTGTPQIECSVTDVPADQGGYLAVTWGRHIFDEPSALVPVTEYDIQRYAENWELLATVAASGAESYTAVVSTNDILTLGQPKPYSRYRVMARTSDPAIFYESRADSAYSIDNIPPPKPAATLVDAPDYRYIVWTNPDVPDFASACVFRGTEAGFTPGEPLTCPASNIYTETHLAWYFYRVQFADIHGNLSEFSDELHGQWPTGVPGVLPTALRLHPCRPNPFNPRTTIKFDLPEAESVRLAVFDLAGRLVRMLVDENRSPGTYEVAWDGRDTEGREVGSGTYLARLEAGGNVEVMRMALLR